MDAEDDVMALLRQKAAELHAQGIRYGDIRHAEFDHKGNLVTSASPADSDGWVYAADISEVITAAGGGFWVLMDRLVAEQKAQKRPVSAGAPRLAFRLHPTVYRREFALEPATA